ncbi:hypothetical protein [Bradyrhizobium jicamae]|uniref:glycosyltransferase n=1 Tax=Bradyrhizobium jicamae TaxID=280332 RepID=UPI001BA612B6|nr:hypothetical protein [Bradyrhizobium jicamae]MBR0938035.1 hypothetical protein [Bradyrhizobium jicamae]
MLLKKVNRFVKKRDYALLASLLDGLREFLDPDQSPEAQKFWTAFIADCQIVAEDRLRRGRINSLWGVTPIANLSAQVAADRALNVNAKTLVFNTYYTTSDFDFVFTEIQDRVIAERGQDLYLFRWLVLMWALASFDIFHLFNDRGIVEPAGGYGSSRFGIAVREMEIYRCAGKRLYTYAYGADHRMRNKTLALGKWSFCSECPAPGSYCVCDDHGGGKMLEVIRKYSTAVVAHGLAIKMIPGARNVPYLTVDVGKLHPRPPVRHSRDKFVVGHFPNHPYFKGTSYLENAIRNLQAEGRPIELSLLSGKPNDEILAAMREVDVLVDQLVSGSFGLTAVEAMGMGCPVICYLHAGVDVADLEACPIIPANPDTIENVLRSLMSDFTRLSAAGAAGPGYVRKNYSIEALAKHLSALYIETAALPWYVRAKMGETAKSLDPGAYQS